MLPLAAGLDRLVELGVRSEEHTSELQSRFDLVCRLLLEKKKRDMRTSGNSHSVMDGLKMGYWILQVVGSLLAATSVVYIWLMLLQTGISGSSFPTSYGLM